MRSGSLDRRITLQRKSTVQNSTGEQIETWIDLAPVWASKKDLRGNERFAAQQIMAEVDTQFRIRYRAGLTPIDRVFYAGKYYDVKAVLEIGRREGMDLMAQARAE